MSVQTVLSVGQCRPDNAAINQFLKANFDCNVITADLPAETLEAMRREQVDLVLINRKLDADYSDGADILNAIKSDPELAETPVMLVSNFADAQEQAVASGAVYGFGKAELNSPDSVARVRDALSGTQA